jgi:hypothetical protein
MGGLLGLLKGPIDGIISSVGSVIDNLHTSDQEKLEAKLALSQAEMAFRGQLLEADARWAETQADVIKAEANGEGFLQRSWRPILMLTFTFIIAWNFVIAPIFSMESVPVPEDMWELLKIGVGGYIVGRSAEKIAPSVLGRPRE